MDLCPASAAQLLLSRLVRSSSMEVDVSAVSLWPSHMCVHLRTYETHGNKNGNMEYSLQSSDA